MGIKDWFTDKDYYEYTKNRSTGYDPSDDHSISIGIVSGLFVAGYIFLFDIIEYILVSYNMPVFWLLFIKLIFIVFGMWYFTHNIHYYRHKISKTLIKNDENHKHEKNKL